MARTDQRALPIALMVLAAVLLVARFAYTPAQPRAAVRWMSPAEGLLQAQRTGKGVLIDFTAEWCAPCRQLDKEVFTDPVLAAEINERFVPVRVTDRKQEDGRNPAVVASLQQRYSVRGFPTVVFTDPSGAEQARMEGFSSRDHFERILRRVR